MMVEMLELFLSILAADWIYKNVDPVVARGTLGVGAIVLVVSIVIASGSVVCLVALALVAGILGLNYFKNHSTHL